MPAGHERVSGTRALLTALGKLWLAGVPLDWRGFYAHERRQRVVLPTYPFERQRYWLAGALPPQTSRAPIEEPAEKQPELGNWFYAPTWKQVPQIQDRYAHAQPVKQHCWLILTDNRGLGEQIACQLRRQQQPVIVVQCGIGFCQISEDAYTIHSTARADYALLFKELRRRNLRPDRIVHMWSLMSESEQAESQDPPGAALERGFYSLLTLAQALGEQTGDPCEILVISNEMQDVLGNERINPLQATLLGPCRVIPQEYTDLSCRSIDLVLPEHGSWQEEAIVRQLIHELNREGGEAVVALRGQRSWVQHFEPTPQAALPHQHPLLRQGGVYLITGGLGGLGLAMADFLAQHYQARLVLIGRNGLPPRAQWLETLQKQAEENTTTRRIRRVMDLEKHGASVLTLEADVTDAKRMRAVIEQAEATFGALHGVVHAAGVPAVGLIQLKTGEQAAQVLAPKVLGTIALTQALRGRELDFLALFSSVTAITGGGPGQVDYCAANAFLDAYAHSRAGEPGLTLAIDWSEWQWNAWEAGLSGYSKEAQAHFQANRQRLGITFTEGAEAFARALAAGLSQIVVSPQDFQVVAAQSTFFTAAEVLERTRQQRAARSSHARPELASSYISPGSELETRIAALWEDLLGVAPVGLHDNFFELGGNSLLGIDLIARLRQLCQVETLGAHILYEAPTVSALADYLTPDKPDRAVNTSLERGKRRREGIKQLIYETRRMR